MRGSDVNGTSQMAQICEHSAKTGALSCISLLRPHPEYLELSPNRFLLENNAGILYMNKIHNNNNTFYL